MNSLHTGPLRSLLETAQEFRRRTGANLTPGSVYRIERRALAKIARALRGEPMERSKRGSKAA